MNTISQIYFHSSWILLKQVLCYLFNFPLIGSHKKINIPTDWIDMVSPCIKEMKKQVQAELDASLQYMAMGAYFSRDVVNRPGFAKLFFDSAKEERQHSIKLISYLLNRGELTSEVSSLIKRINIPDKTEWVSGVDALKDALKLEAQVTKKIRKVIIVCEDPSKASKEETTNFNDYEVNVNFG